MNKKIFSENDIVKKATEAVLRKGGYVFDQSEIDELKEDYYSYETSFRFIGFEVKTSYNFYLNGLNRYTLKLDALKNLSEDHFKLWFSKNKFQTDIVRVLLERYFAELYHYLKNQGVDFSKIEIDTGFCYRQQNQYSISQNVLTYVEYDYEDPNLEVWNTGGDFLIEKTALLTDEAVLRHLTHEIYEDPDDFNEYPSDIIKLILNFVEKKLLKEEK